MKKIGEGSFGCVYKINTKYNKEYALKTFPEKQRNYLFLGTEIREVDILSRLRNPFINEMLDYNANYVVQEIESKHALTFPLAYGTLYDLADKLKKFKVHQSYFTKYFLQLLLGLKYVHDRGIILADIKPDNILYFRFEEIVKFTDFGLAIYDDGLFKSNAQGCLSFAPPEVLIEKLTIGKASDVWSLGMTFLEVLTDEIPQNYICSELSKKSPKEILSKLHENIQKTLRLVEDKDLSSMIEQMLQVDYKKRATVDQLLKLPIFSIFSDKIKIINKLYEGCPIMLLYSNTRDFTINSEIYNILTDIYRKCSKEGEYWSWFNTVDILNYLINVDFVKNDFKYAISAAFSLSMKLYYNCGLLDLEKFLSDFNMDYTLFENMEVNVIKKLGGKIYRKNIFSFLYNMDIDFDVDKLSKFVLSTSFEGEMPNYAHLFLESNNLKSKSTEVDELINA